MNPFRWMRDLNRALAGWPDATLTWILTGLSLLGLTIAWLGKPALKALAILYAIFP